MAVLPAERPRLVDTESTSPRNFAVTSYSPYVFVAGCSNEGIAGVDQPVR